ncbi:MAG: phenylalanine 4-monooxygenase [Gemmatimonadetes bacterium]|nr:phenylalanine 4-monooxygenase [Gemmatimonadota bacterium]
MPTVRATPHATASAQPTLPADAHAYPYTATDRAVWRVLVERRMPALEATVSEVYLDGARTIGLVADEVPQLPALNARLTPRTGWRAVPTPGFMPAAAFFASLARREFPTVRALRSPAQLDYVEAPDLFHDVFGHVPLHADPAFASFLSRVGALGALLRGAGGVGGEGGAGGVGGADGASGAGADGHATSAGATVRAQDARAEPPVDPRITELARLFWFTVEFGLKAEPAGVRIYGSGLISSHADAANALSDACERRPFAPPSRS